MVRLLPVTEAAGQKGGSGGGKVQPSRTLQGSATQSAPSSDGVQQSCRRNRPARLQEPCPCRAARGPRDPERGRRRRTDLLPAGGARGRQPHLCGMSRCRCVAPNACVLASGDAGPNRDGGGGRTAVAAWGLDRETKCRRKKKRRRHGPTSFEYEESRLYLACWVLPHCGPSNFFAALPTSYI